ncbi:MAG: hypothetical protein ACJA2D_001625 [Pseudohongiellaceae bacterium]|jgi:hypothetical protein
MGPITPARDLFICDRASQPIAYVRNVSGGDVFNADASLMSARLYCLNENSSVADAYNFVAKVTANFREGRNNALTQVGTR